MMKRLLTYVNGKKKLATTMMMMAIIMCSTAMCFAADESPTAQVLSSFGTLKTDIMAVMAGIGTLAIGIYAVFLGWNYGKKIFKTVSK